MSRNYADRDGKIPLHTLRADIDYGFTEAKTPSGNIGVKVWVYRGDILPEMRTLEQPKREPMAIPAHADPGGEKPRKGWRRVGPGPTGERGRSEPPRRAAVGRPRRP